MQPTEAALESWLFVEQMNIEINITPSNRFLATPWLTLFFTLIIVKYEIIALRDYCQVRLFWGFYLFWGFLSRKRAQNCWEQLLDDIVLEELPDWNIHWERSPLCLRLVQFIFSAKKVIYASFTYYRLIFIDILLKKGDKVLEYMINSQLNFRATVRILTFILFAL